MRLINTEIGRVIRLFPVEDIRPPGGLHPPTAMRMLGEKYSFGYTPDPRHTWEEAQRDGLKFQLGKLVHGNRTINVNDFTLYNDGIVATATSTNDADIFLDDLLAWGKEVFGFRDVSPATSRTLYYSNVIVEFELSPNSLLGNFAVLSDGLLKLLRTTYGLDIPVQLNGVGFHIDRTEAGPAWQTLSQFTLERRLNQPFSQNRFTSEAPFKTNDHLSFLAIIDSLLNVGASSSAKKVKSTPK